MKSLENRVALVTGSTSGIGLSMARRFAMAGAEVVMNGFGDPAEIAGGALNPTPIGGFKSVQ